MIESTILSKYFNETIHLMASLILLSGENMKRLLPSKGEVLLINIVFFLSKGCSCFLPDSVNYRST
jgi:hypothetical protein